MRRWSEGGPEGGCEGGPDGGPDGGCDGAQKMVQMEDVMEVQEGGPWTVDGDGGPDGGPDGGCLKRWS